jgi:OOP family OmpA-OmpF porin
MSGYSGNKILSVAGILLTVAVTTTSAESYYLLNCKGNPITTAILGKCIKTQTPNNPSKLFEVCGDIIDTDKDGIPDKEDKCPNNTPEEIAKGVYQSGSKKGCPKDTDKDGVPDYKDECPNTPIGAKVDAKGCQIKVKKKSVNVIKMKSDVITLSGDVTFAFAKFKLTVQAHTMLAELVKQLNLNLIKSLEIVGHTDSVGRKSSNKTLSEHRAKVVANYLIKLGIPPEKISFRGDGESKPIANNRTKIGRAQNRRVEIGIIRFIK